MEKKIEKNVISKEISVRQQDVDYIELIEICGEAFGWVGNAGCPEFEASLFKIDIRSNAYSSQCHAKIFIYSRTELEWKHFHEVKNMKTPTSLYVKDSNELTEDLFAEDRQELLRVAERVFFDE